MSAAGDDGMSPPAVLVKEEPVWEVDIVPAALHVKAELEGDGGMPAVLVKEEREWDGASKAGLYADYEVKAELVLGPEHRQPYIVYDNQSLSATDTVTVKQEVAGEQCLVEKLPGGAAHLAREQLAHGASSVKLKRISVDENLHTCLMCHKSFLHKSSLMTHICNHNDTLICKKVLGNCEENQYNIYSCNLCEKLFATKSSINVHLKTHMEKKPTHKRLHPGQRQFACEICKKRFKHKCNLTAHKLYDHGRKFTCEICKIHFTQSFQLASHKLQHTTDKPFSCEICKKQYKHKGSLTGHKLKKHPYKRIINM